MAFMQPEVTKGCATVEFIDGSSQCLPIEYALDSACWEQESDQLASITFHRDEWCGRYSAPGYLDATEWSGPYDTEEEATFEVRALFGDDEEEEEEE